jgi:hypothetical protein
MSDVSHVHVFQDGYVRSGIESIKVCWQDNLHTLAVPPGLEPRKDPRDTDFDLHVNIISSEGHPEVRDFQIFLTVCSRKSMLNVVS